MQVPLSNLLLDLFRSPDDALSATPKHTIDSFVYYINRCTFLELFGCCHHGFFLFTGSGWKCGKSFSETTYLWEGICFIFISFFLFGQEGDLVISDHDIRNKLILRLTRQNKVIKQKTKIEKYCWNFRRIWENLPKYYKNKIGKIAFLSYHKCSCQISPEVFPFSFFLFKHSSNS